MKDLSHHFILMLLFISLLFSCNKPLEEKMIDPIFDFKIGDSEYSWSRKVDSLKKLHLLFNQLEIKDVEYSTYSTYIVNGQDSVKCDIEINSFPYYYGKLRSLELNLKGDSVEYWDGSGKYYSRSYGPRDKEDVDRVFDWYVEYYGIPHDTLRGSFDLLKLEFDKSSDYYSIRQSDVLHRKLGSYIWNQEGYYIEFNKTFHEKDLTKYSNAYIRYVSDSMREDVIKISDSIKLGLKPQDLVGITLDRFRWKDTHDDDYDTLFSVELERIMRIGLEETRAITDIKMDLVFRDRFDDELYRFKDLKLHLDNPIEPHFGLVPINNGFTYTQPYDRNSKNFKELDKLRKMKRSQYKLEPDFKSVVFIDGKVLNAN